MVSKDMKDIELKFYNKYCGWEIKKFISNIFYPVFKQKTDEFIRALRAMFWWQVSCTLQFAFWSGLFYLWDVREGAQKWLWFSYMGFTYFHMIILAIFCWGIYKSVHIKEDKKEEY